MDPIHKRSQIEANLDRLESFRRSIEPKVSEFYGNLLRRGICFIAYTRDGKICFAPSRFVGYVNNDIRRHRSNHSKDGRVTNRAISKTLGYAPAPDDHLEHDYVRFCTTIGVTPGKAGPFQTRRKYWSEV